MIRRLNRRWSDRGWSPPPGPTGDPEIDVNAQLFDGMRHLYLLYRRHARRMGMGMAIAFVGMIVTISLAVYNVGALRGQALEQQRQREDARQALAAATQRVATESCQAQNQHRMVEVEILRRGIGSIRAFRKEGTITKLQEDRIVSEQKKNIRELGPLPCNRIIGQIPGG